MLRAIWNFRGFVISSVRREYQLRYRGTMLGVAWTVLQPLAMIFIYTVIFSQMMRAKLPGVDGTFAYSIYLCAGVITWGLFAEILNRSQSVFLDNANLLKKLSFPRLTLPVIVVATASLNFIIVFVLFLIFLLLTGNAPDITLLAIIPLLLIQILFAVGLGVVLGVVNVFFRDVGQLSSLLLQFWFWATPVVYPVAILPESLRFLIQFNPMYHLIHAYQNILVAHQWPQWQHLAILAGITIALDIYALNLFRRHSGEIVDEI
jgi:lipopolysaccharide transport system permease protein